MINQKAFVIPGPEMDGLWDRGTQGFGPNTCPRTGFLSSKQVRYLPGGCRTRQGYGSVAANTAWIDPKQILQYSTNNTTTGAVVNGFLIVTNGGLVYDSISPTPGTPIHSIGGNYISILTLFGRIYITEHTTTLGTNTYVDYYIPGSGSTVSGTGGSPANIITAGTNFASSGTAGHVTQGLHVFGIAFETRTGHITQIVYNTIAVSSVGAFTLANANQQVTATNVPISADPVVRRHILASRVITGYSGNPTDYALYYVTTINDNITTTITFDFTDESLLDSADYLYDLIVGIPAGVGLTWYSNRLLVHGVTYTGPITPALGPSVIWASLPGKPESFSTVDGFIEVFKDDGEFGIVNAFEQDGLLTVTKQNKTYVTRDNQDVPNTWQVSAVDYTLGSTCFGVTKSLNSTGAAKSGKTVVLNKSGIYLFQGQFIERALTWKVERKWKELSESVNYNKFQILDIPQAQSFIVTVFDSSYYWLVADYSRGLDWQNIRWSEWRTNNPAVFATLHDNTTVYFVSGIGSGTTINSMLFGSTDDYANDDDISTKIPDCELITSEIKFDEFLNKYQLVQIRVRGKSFEPGGELNDSVLLSVGEDSYFGPPSIALHFNPNTAAPTPEIIKAAINFSGYYPKVKMSWTGQALEAKQIVISGNVSSEDKLTV